jgi:hypothetical protein
MFLKTINIPIEICSDALKKRRVRALQVFIYLKLKCSGKIKIDQQFLKNTANELGLKSIKTIKASITDLLHRHWISISNKSGYYFVKGFDRIRKLHNFQKRNGAEFSIDDIKKFKAFLIAAIISNLINAQKRRLKAIELSKGGSKTTAFKQSFFYPVANGALAKILGISISTAYEWKKLAKKQGYIKIRANSRKIDDLYPETLNQFKKYGDKSVKGIRTKKGHVFEQLPDNVYSKVSLRRRRKLEVI